MCYIIIALELLLFGNSDLENDINIANLQLTGLKECHIPMPNALVCKQYG
jgi:hypothetical protein